MQFIFLLAAVCIVVVFIGPMLARIFPVLLLVAAFIFIVWYLGSGSTFGHAVGRVTAHGLHSVKTMGRSFADEVDKEMTK